MQKRSIHQRRLLMGLSMTALLLFMVYWLFQSYRIERRILEKEINFSFFHAIRHLEDSLVHESFVDSIQNTPRRIHRLRLADTVSSESSLRTKVYRSPSHHKAGFKNRQFPGMLGMLLMSSTIRDSTQATNTVRQLIESTFHNVRQTEDIPKSTELIFGRPDSVRSDCELTSVVYSDMRTNVQAYIRVPDYHKFVIWALWPHLTVVLLLLLLMGLTMMVFLRNEARQQRLIEARTALVANMTHELNTPITSASLALQMLGERLQGREAEQKYVQIANSQLLRLTDMADTMLKSHTSAEKRNAVKEEVDLLEMTKSAIDDFQLRISQSKASVNLQATNPPYPLMANPEEIAGVLRNLIDNALKYGGRDNVIHIDILSKGNQVVWRITDSGPGIPAEYREQVFEQLFRIPTGDVHNTSGYGLGLYIVRNVIRAHGGNVKVVSDAGRGATFEISLPSLTNAD